jgi:two-component system response regulator PilR (NtrC family)
LENLMERSVALSTTNIILPDSLAMATHKRRWVEGTENERFDLDEVESGVNLTEILSKIEKAYLNKAMACANGNKKLAAKLLGLGYRSLWHRLDKIEGLEDE